MSAAFDRRLFLVGSAGILAGATLPDQSVLWLDQLEDPGRSVLGTQWGAFTDGVMGGVSEMGISLVTQDGERAYRMQGQVRTANNGGFVQMALPLSRTGRDVSGYDGVRLRVRGNGERYAVHVRTGQNGRPWDYFSADFETRDRWVTVSLPFADFERSQSGAPIDPTTVQRIALVAIGRDFAADVSLAALGLYKGSVPER